jgi:hypothetical protein
LEAYAQANGWPKVRAGWCCIDLMPPTNNSLHLVGETQIQSQRRLVQSILHEVVPGLAPSKGIGPRIASIVRNGSTLTATVTVAHDGGDLLQGANGGAAITGFTAGTGVDTAGNLTGPITVTAAIASGNTITLTFSQLPAYVHYMRGMTPDTSNCVRDNVTYPSTCIGSDLRTGLPLLPTPDAIQVT